MPVVTPAVMTGLPMKTLSHRDAQSMAFLRMPGTDQLPAACQCPDVHGAGAPLQ